jgi:hypothetical protein
MAGKPFQDLVERFFGRKQFKKVTRLVRLDDSSPRARKMPATVLAETIRCVPLTDYTIHLNWRFRVQQDAHPLAIENKRLRFVTAVTIIHEIWHLCLRHNGILNTPERLRGLWGPEAGEFFEKMLFGGLITMRLSKDERNNTNTGWNPGEMKVTAVLLRNVTTVALSDYEIEKICDLAASQVCLPADTFPVSPVGLGRKVGQHALKRADGVHEGLRSRKYLKREKLDFDDSLEHNLDAGCALSFRKSKKQRS